jgi:DNA-directed RNA polymerase subunit F
MPRSTAGRLPASLLPRLHEQLSAIALDALTSDDARLSANFTSLFALVSEPTDSAATYLRELDAEVADLAANGERLAAYKKAVLAYLERFNRELNLWAPQIVEKLIEIEPHIDDMILRAAIVDAAPRPEGTVDESPLDQLVEQ